MHGTARIFPAAGFKISAFDLYLSDSNTQCRCEPVCNAFQTGTSAGHQHLIDLDLVVVFELDQCGPNLLNEPLKWSSYGIQFRTWFVWQ